MTTISTSTTKPKNDRKPPRKPTAAEPAPKPDIIGKVEFNLKPEPETGTLTLEIRQVSGVDTGPDRLVGETPKGDRYLRVPTGKRVQIDFLLGGPWQWFFPHGMDGVTLADENHFNRYWLTDHGDPKMRRLIIEPSGGSEETQDTGSNDEKFNLELVIKQAKGKELAIEIDPITKNPPPIGGFTPIAGEPGPLL